MSKILTAILTACALFFAYSCQKEKQNDSLEGIWIISESSLFYMKGDFEDETYAVENTTITFNDGIATLISNDKKARSTYIESGKTLVVDDSLPYIVESFTITDMNSPYYGQTGTWSHNVGDNTFTISFIGNNEISLKSAVKDWTAYSGYYVIKLKRRN